MAGLTPPEEDEEPKSKDLTAATFLLGGVTFVMSLFYLVNHPDMDIRQHTWKVINATVSIFVSVLLFQGITGVSDAISDTNLQSQSHQTSAKIGFAYFMFFIFYCTLHLILYNLSYSKEDSATEIAAVQRSSSVLASLENGTFEQRRRRQIACWATLLSHMAGFAHIRCSLDLQQLEIFKDGYLVVVPTLLNALLLVGIFKLSDGLRSRYMTSSTTAGFNMWEEGAEEAEDDIAAIGISFSMVVVLRFLLTDQMANPMGLELPVKDHAMYAKLSICGSAVVFALISIIILMVNTRLEKKKGAHKLIPTEPESHRLPYMTRWALIASSTFATGASWCGLYGAKWFLYGFERGEGDANPNTCISRVICALLVSFGSFILIYFLDKLKDLEATGESADRAIEEVIHAVGVSVGFAWEQSFDAGVETIGELTMHMGSWYPVWARLAFACMISAVMIPAWRLYLIKKSLEAHEKCRNCGAVLVIDARYCHMCSASKPLDDETPKAR